MRGYRLRVPDIINGNMSNQSLELWNVIKNCWDEDPDSRDLWAKKLSKLKVHFNVDKYLNMKYIGCFEEEWFL